MTDSTYLSASFWRRFAAMVYDSLVMFAVLIFIGATMLPFTRGLGISPGNPVFTIYVFGAIFIFLGWLWTHGGQTLGMRAWKIRLLQANGSPVSWQLGFLYYLVSLPGWGAIMVAAFYIVLEKVMPTLHQLYPAWLAYSVAIAWFVVDHLPNNWREKLTGLRMIQVGE